MPDKINHEHEISLLLEKITGERPVAETNEKGILVTFSDANRLTAAGISIENPPRHRDPKTYTFPDTIETIHALEETLREVIDERAKKDAEDQTKVDSKEHLKKYRRPITPIPAPLIGKTKSEQPGRRI